MCFGSILVLARQHSRTGVASLPESPGLDRRFGWSQVPLPVVLLADLLVVAAYGYIATVLKTNSYASRIVEVERQQSVIRSGPYAHVRHPMYSGVFVMDLATPVALGSWWGMLPILGMPLLVVRILNEEKALREQLPGYRDFCREVRWRLLPLVW